MEEELDLDSEFPYGKHKGETVESVIIDDPSYITWWADTVTQFQFTEAVLDALEELRF